MINDSTEDAPKECMDDGCHAPVREHEDFCSEDCWEWWHRKHDPETYERWRWPRTAEARDLGDDA
ncbi:hypothetical protein AB0E27_31425 [Streptomyces sparsogenes]|uniref:hypothetical protein n=1 Tax=Streptomyces sparsogenes TaxID=67365 RepID=UPI00340CC73D